jgi:hypothetical protein
MVKGGLPLSRLDYGQIPTKMSRGGRGGFGGRGRGRGGSSASTMPNTGLTHEEMQIAQMRREPQPLYPVYCVPANQTKVCLLIHTLKAFTDIPILTPLSEREREACKLQLGFADRLKQSPYYLKEVKKDLGTLGSHLHLQSATARSKSRVGIRILQTSYDTRTNINPWQRKGRCSKPHLWIKSSSQKKSGKIFSRLKGVCFGLTYVFVSS